MDNLWERSLPFYNLGSSEIIDIFSEYDTHLEVLDYFPIHIGCRNSNYKVLTNKGCFLLRVCAPNDTSYKKEKPISDFFHGHINIPQLLFLSEDNLTRRICLIYEYIHGDSMQNLLLQKSTLEDNILIQVAENASYIHNSDLTLKLEPEIMYPPFSTWYDLFLGKEVLTDRIGKDIQTRAMTMIEHKKEDLKEIEKYTGFIHSDFRPANMLIDKNNRVFIVDWEFSGNGHRLADIGQFFRYADCFEPGHFKIFEEVYNLSSRTALPSDWIELSKLRDLINPLQMLGAKDNLPQKYADLKNLILDTLNFFGY